MTKLDQAPQENTEPPSIEPESGPDAAGDGAESFTADDVAKLRAEAASHRIKAKRTDDANARLLQAYAATDGRLIDADVLAYTDDLLGDDGLINQAKVAEQIGALLSAKPYLATRKPTSTIAQGVLPTPVEMPGLLSLIKARV